MPRGMLLGVVLALGAFATAHGATAPADATDRLAVRVVGKITARCLLAQTGPAQASFGEILNSSTGGATANVLELPISLDCNAPYRATLTSSRGALAFAGSAVSGFASTVTYRAELGLTSGGGVHLACDSADMRTSATTSDRTSAPACSAAASEAMQASTTGRVRLTLNAGTVPLLKGTYSDDLTLRIAPNVSGEG